MIDRKSAILVAAVTILPGLAYIGVHGLLHEWVAWVAMGCISAGAMVATFGILEGSDKARAAFGWIGGTLLMAGLLATAYMDH
ncbi:hypothetical protein EBL89_03695 [Cereibacter sphaeroides]|uniref:hypothetical protein n=1 Tax=Cereibacter sphaeroides TaxID=1063 RepID=UPI000E5A46EB|nr:hypothetical protein [Cereibacter sphaeroides]AZB54469.1 hypothetical protein EBL89_03695 [Cereibacter sphaeroides]AZB58742.1 hypothetical protein EBL88_03780 [Cereibacter sphaeroides]RIA01370.1 hypothetical protein D1122_01530 [Cereibacter sphaeroides]